MRSPGLSRAYRLSQGAENAKLAGFDGVEIHGLANGYLLDQFLQDSTEPRVPMPTVDRSRIEARLMLEVGRRGGLGLGSKPGRDAPRPRAAMPTRWGIPTVPPPSAMWPPNWGERGLAFLCAREHLGEARIGPELKRAFGGTYIANEKFTKETAEQVIEAGEADAVAFGVQYIANPDLQHRFAINAPSTRRTLRRSTPPAPGIHGLSSARIGRFFRIMGHEQIV